MVIATTPIKPIELLWLSDVRESVQPLTPAMPIWVRTGIVREGPAIPHPERHPYCEFGVNLEGEGYQFVGGEKAIRRPGDLFMAPPGLPHWHEIRRYPLRFIAVYFLPNVLLEIGGADGLALLRRFTSGNALAHRLLRPPPALRRRLLAGVVTMAGEFANRPPGFGLRLRTLLADMLLDVARWESTRRSTAEAGTAQPRDLANWDQIDQALRYLHANFAQPIYAADLARAICSSETGVKSLFRDALGIPWGRYLRTYRIQRAASLLATTSGSITDIAAQTGFESLSHFESTFREYLGTSPKGYASMHITSLTKSR